MMKIFGKVDVNSPGTLSISFYVKLIALIGLSIRIGFIVYADRVWEDGLIAVLHVENFLNGMGLTHFKPDGVRVQGFTSPLGILIPLFGGALFGAESSLGFLRYFSATLVIPLLFVARKIWDAAKSRQNYVGLIFLLGYLSFEHHQYLWGTAGLETSVALLSVFILYFSSLRGSWLHFGLAIAFCIYSRPDLLFAVIVASLIFWNRFGLFVTLKAGFLSVILYLPWFVWSFAYFGSIIPNTILAKSLGYGLNFSNLTGKFLDLLVPLGPSFAGHGSGYWRLLDKGWISLGVAVLALFGMIQVFRKREQSLYLPVAFALVYLFYYEFFVTGVFGWYLVPLSATLVLLAAYGVAVLRLPIWLRWSFVAVYLVILFALNGIQFKAQKEIQEYVENKVRREMGLFLGSIMNESDYIGAEPLGYLGYYSRRAVLDYPGLASKEVVGFLKGLPQAGFCTMLDHFKPRYLLLRHYECVGHAFLNEYVKLRDFQADPRFSQTLLADKNIDIHFIAFERKDLENR